MRRRLRWWWAMALLPLLVVLTLLVVAFLPHIVTGERIRTEAVSALTELLGAPVQIDRVEYQTLSGIEIEKFTIGPPPGFTENVLSLERAVVRWELGGIFGRHLVVNEIRVVAPVFTVETRSGQRNLDVILAHLSKDPPEEPAPEVPERGPLLPLDIDLTALEIAPVTLRLAGEGPNAKLEGARLSVDGHACRERLDVRIGVHVDPAEGNATLVLPQGDLEVLAQIGFELKIEVKAATANGLALERATVHLDTENRLFAKWGDEVIEPATVSTVIDVVIDPSDDRAKVERVEVKLDGSPLVMARAELDGIAALLGALAGDALVATLGSSVGLIDRKRSGSADVSVDQLLLPLDRFERWVQLFVPDLELDGRVEMMPFQVSGNAQEIARGEPSKLHLVLKLDGVGLALPSAQLAVDEVAGTFEGARRNEGGYSLQGALAIARVRQAKNRVGEAKVELSATVDRIGPQLGRTEARVGIDLSGVEAPPARVPAATVHVQLSGTDPLSADREDPIHVRASVEVPSVRIAQSSTASIDLSGLKVAVDAALDRLLQPANQPITAEVDLSLARASLGSARSVERAALLVSAKATDPRRGAVDAEAKVSLKIGTAIAPPAKVSDATIGLTLNAQDMLLPELPKRVALKLAVASPSVAVSARELGDVATPLAIEASLTADPVAASANIERLTVDLQDVLTLRLKGRGARLLSENPWVDGQVEAAIHLEKLVAKIPRNLLREIPDLTAEGKVELTARAKGAVPKSFEKTALVSQPIEAQVRIGLDGVGVESKQQSILLSSLNGAIVAETGGGKFSTHTELDAAKIIQGRAPLQNRIEKLTVRNQIELADEVWTVASHVLAASIHSAYGAEGAVEGASIDLDVTYPQRGDLHLARFDVHAPGNGVELSISGRLRRRAFGVFRPDLSVRANLDLDRLRHLLPQLAGGKGKASAVLTVASRSDRVVDVEGSVEAKRFSWEVPQILTVLNATGRLPVSQRILLPAPELDVTVARAAGALGDDFEARATELLHDFSRSKGLLATEDILVEAPRSADYQTLRPYYAQSGTRLTIEGIVFRNHAIEDVTLEGMWSSGVLRVDRLACRLWEGDLLGDLAVQFTPDQNVRMRLRGTITDLNVDLPYAIIKGVEPVTDPDDKEDYRVTGQMDLEFALKQRAVNARIDLTKLKLPLVRRVFATMDLPDRARSALEMAQLVGVRPSSGKIWIANNLLNVNFDWQRLWLHVSLDQESFLGKTLDVVLFPFRFLAIPTVGGYVIKTVNDTIRDFSISAVLDDVIGQARVEQYLRVLEGRVIAADKASGAGLPNQASADMLSPR